MTYHPSQAQVYNAANLPKALGCAWSNSAGFGAVPQNGWGASSAFGAGAYGAGTYDLLVRDPSRDWLFGIARSTGRIEILAGSVSGVGTVYLPGTPAWDDVAASLSSHDPQAHAALMPFRYEGSQAVKVTETPQQGTGGVMQSLAKALGLAGSESERAEAQARVGRAAEQYGPGIISGVQTLLASRGASLASLQRKLSRKRGKFLRETNAGKKLQLSYEIKALQDQIANYRSRQAAAQAALVPREARKRFPVWLPIVVIGGFGLITLAALAGRKRR